MEMNEKGGLNNSFRDKTPNRVEDTTVDKSNNKLKFSPKYNTDYPAKDNLSLNYSFLNFDPSNIRGIYPRNSLIKQNENRKSFKKNEDMKNINQAKEIIQILQKFSEIDNKQYFPNIFVLGSKKIGKTSLIEYMIGYDLFLPEIINVPVKINIFNNPKLERLGLNPNIENMFCKYLEVAKNDDKFIDDNIEPKESDQNFLIFCDHSLFKSVKEFHERLSERSNIEISNNKFLEIKLMFYGKNHPLFNYDVNFLEIPNEYLENIENNEELKSLIQGENNIFLVILAFDHFERLEYYKNMVSKYDPNFQNTIFVINKSDMIENRNEAISIIEKLKNLKYYTFIRNRKVEERKSMTIQDYYEEEKKFFNSSRLFNNFETSYGLTSVYDMIDKILLNKNFFNINTEEYKRRKCENEKFLSLLGEAIPKEENLKRQLIYDRLKQIIRSVKDTLLMNKNCLIYYFEYFHKIKKQVKNNSQLDNMNKFNNSFIFKDLKNFEINYLDKLEITSYKVRNLLSEIEADKITKQTMEALITKQSKAYFSTIFDVLKKIFDDFYEKLLIDISLIINRNLLNIHDTFVLLVKEIFFTFLKNEFDNFIKYCNLYKELETNLLIIKENKTFQKINFLYENILKTSYFVSSDSEKKLKEIFEEIIASYVLSFIETYTKSYSYFLIDKCIEKIHNISLIDIRIDLFEETDDILKKRKVLAEENECLERLFNLLDLSEKLKQTLPHTLIERSLSIESYPIQENKINTLDYKSSKSLKDNELIMIWDSTEFISVFTFKSLKIQKQMVKGIPNNKFLENNRYVHLKDKIFISGGMYKDNPSNLFICLERPNNYITTLKELPVKVVRQSLIIVRNEYLILAGGVNNTKCYSYSIKNDDWHQIQTLNVIHEDSTLFILNSEYIFCLGGLLINSFDNFIEYIQFNSDYHFVDMSNLKWNSLTISNKAYIDKIVYNNLIYLSGAGVIILDNSLLICGGYNSNNSEEYTNVFSLNIYFNDVSFIEANINLCNNRSLKLPNWFPEPVFVYNNGKEYNYDLDGNIIFYEKEKEIFDKIDFEFYSN